MFSLRDWWLIESCPSGMIDLWGRTLSTCSPRNAACRLIPVSITLGCLDCSIEDPDASILVVRHYHQHLVLFYFYFCCVRVCDLLSSAFHYISCIHACARLLDGRMWTEIQVILPMWVIILDFDGQMWLEILMILPMWVIMLDLIWLAIVGDLDDTPYVSDRTILQMVRYEDDPVDVTIEAMMP